MSSYWCVPPEGGEQYSSKMATQNYTQLSSRRQHSKSNIMFVSDDVSAKREWVIRFRPQKKH